MPELPEVETIRLQLVSKIIGWKITLIEILNSKSFIGNPELILYASVVDIRRLGKILLIDLDNGISLAVHLKMTGQVIISFKVSKNQSFKNNNDKYLRVIIHFTNKNLLLFRDMRKFGWMKIVDSKTVKDIQNKLGPDPLNELTEESFYQILKQSGKPIKQLLMNQEKIAGIGNIYANEALFLAGIRPTCIANKISRQISDSLFLKLLKLLKEAIKFKGTSSRNFRDTSQEKGSMQDYLSIYQQEYCPNCHGKVRRLRQAGRSTFFCSKCQK